MTDGQNKVDGDDVDEPLERIPRSYWQLMPKRTLVKGVWLLLMLAAIFWFQARASSCARVYTETIAPGGAARSPAAPENNQGQSP